MSPKDKDALIKRVKAFEKALHSKGRMSANIYLAGGALTSKDLRALISLASPSPAQTKTADDEEDDFPDLPKCKHGVGIFGDRIKCEECDAESASAGPPGVWLNSPSPAQWPEEAVERATGIYEQAMIDSGSTPRVWQREVGIAAMRAALATLPPPEDERVKGLETAFMRLMNYVGALNGSDDAIAAYEDARSALASYRGEPKGVDPT